MINYDEALQRVLATVTPLDPVELALPDAAGLVLASPAKARWDLPGCDNSAMDGFAIAGIPAAPGAGLTIAGASYAGHPYPDALVPGQALRITTGAIMPPGADTVVPLEEVDEKDGRIHLKARPQRGQHVRYRGEEYRVDEVLLAAGATLRAGDIALLASAGVDRVRVYPRPRVAVISTGDELVALGRQPGPGQVVNSNLHLLRTRLAECGCTDVGLDLGADDPHALGRVIDRALDADLLISSGGVSVGEKDYVQTVLGQRDFRKIFWKVAIKPGKPVLFGMLAGKPYFGLPGNPAATAATFELFVKPALNRLAGQLDVQPVKRRAILTDAVTGGGSRQAFLWCRLEWHEEGYRVTVSPRQGSGQNRCLSGANAILPLPLGVKRLAAGAGVEVLPLTPSP